MPRTNGNILRADVQVPLGEDTFRASAAAHLIIEILGRSRLLTFGLFLSRFTSSAIHRDTIFICRPAEAPRAIPANDPLSGRGRRLLPARGFFVSEETRLARLVRP